MIVDSDLLRMGAAFSQSAGTIAQRGAVKLSEAVIPSHIFADIEAARAFHRALANAHETHVATLHGFRKELDSLAERAVTAAVAFSTTDHTGAISIDGAANAL
jgi:hypothetical protein